MRNAWTTHSSSLPAVCALDMHQYLNDSQRLPSIIICITTGLQQVMDIPIWTMADYGDGRPLAAQRMVHILAYQNRYLHISLVNIHDKRSLVVIKILF